LKRFHRLFGAKKNSTVDISSEKIFHQQLKIERSRTHRNGHEFSVVIFDLEELQLKKNIEPMIKTIKSRVRNIDHMGWYDKKRIGVILPYTSSKGANEFSKSIIKSVDGDRRESTFDLITYPHENKSFEQNTTEPILRSM